MKAVAGGMGMPGSVFNKAKSLKPKEYESKLTSRVAVPITANGQYGQQGTLEMTVGQEGDRVDFTLIQHGRQALPFSVHRKDLEALFGQLTLDKLAK